MVDRQQEASSAAKPLCGASWPTPCEDCVGSCGIEEYIEAARVYLTTHKVVIDANDEAQAADLYERLHNDGFRVHRERHRLVRNADGKMRPEVERVG